jgi:hypothetical protein
MTQQLQNRIVLEAPLGYVAIPQATCIPGVLPRTILQRVKHGELSVVQVSRCKQKALRIRALDNQTQLFDQPSAAKV